MHSENRLKHNRRNCRRFSFGLGLAGLLILPAALAGDDAYTWKDAAGRVHYGNRPPEGQAATPIPVQPTERIYTWTDSAGKVHYGAHPPADVPAKELKEEDGALSTIHSGQLRSGEQQLLRQWQQD